MSAVNIGNLAVGTTEESLRDFLSYCGEIISVNILPSSESYSAIVTFSTESACSTALYMNNASLAGRNITVTSGYSSMPDAPDMSDERDTDGAGADAAADQYGTVTTVLGRSYRGLHLLGRKIKEGDQRIGFSSAVRTGAARVDEKVHIRDGAQKVNEKTRLGEGVGKLRARWRATRAGQTVQAVKQESVVKSGVDNGGGTDAE
eukprot:gnl/Chilomastix_cuspidata/1416.p2 GENE.gnl/Chilomastix_cuspidata/1416~~gnl/Chilomastix_cuspidata/1416.p2  ORF type:complete len:204 (+),score=82.46 gnl/Chilomastix_cuspidata/1416:1129-1740(+)